MKAEDNKKQVELNDEQLDNVAGGGRCGFVDEKGSNDPNFLKDLSLIYEQ